MNDSIRTIDEFQKRRNIANANYIVCAGSPVYHTFPDYEFDPKDFR